MPKLLSSLKMHLVGIVVVTLIPALAIILYSEIERREYDSRNAHERALVMARNLASEQEQITARTRQMLDMMSGMSEVKSLDAKACNRIFSEIHKVNSDYAAVFAARSNGEVFASSVPYPAGFTLSDREYFQETIKKRGFVISGVSVGRMTGLRTISYAKPVFDRAGKVIAVVVAGFNLDFYKQLITPAELVKGYVVGIADVKGIRIFRYPDTESSVTGVGVQVSPVTLANILGAKEEGTYEGIGSDGTMRIYAYKQLRLEKSGRPYMVIFTGLSKEKALYQATYMQYRNLILLGLSLVVLLALSWYFGKVAILNRMDTLIRTTGRIGDGDLSARTGIPHDSGEFGQLAKAFDEMSASLEEKARDLQRSELRYKQLVENARDMIVRIDLNGRYTFVNSVTLQIAGYSEEEMIGRLYYDFVRPEYRDAAVEFYREQIRTQTVSTYMEFPFVTKDGRDLWMGHNVQLVMEEGKIWGFQAISRDISERRHMEAELEKAAVTDPLTGIYNRRGFILMASHQLLLAERARQGLILCFIDLDDMKQINDVAGHEEGDNALLEATVILREAFRGSDIVARIGGDEFAVLAVGGSVDHWGVLRERLQQQIDQHNAEPGRKFMISMSCGMAYYNPAESCTIDELMARADTLMYNEKRAKKEASVQPL